MVFPKLQLRRKNNLLSFCLIAISFLIILALTGCNLIHVEIVTKESPPQIDTQAAISTVVPPTQAPTATIAPSTQSHPILDASQLSQTGPWFIYPTSRGIMASNPDGSGSVLVSPPSITDFVASEPDIPSGISPDGKMIAHRRNSASGKGWDLEVIALPSLGRNIVTPLISPENLAKTTDDPTLIQAVIAESPIQWSPDGRYLVFVAALDGPSSDLYVYDFRLYKLTRLSSGSLEVARPIWTPDGKQIIYQVVEAFGTGAGWSSKGVWSVKPDGSDNHLLFKVPYDTGPETFVGINNSNIALLKHFDQHGGGLFLANLNTGDLQLVKAGETSAAMDPYGGGYVFIDENGGLFFAAQPDTNYQQVDSNDYSNGRVYWDNNYIGFYVNAETLAVVGPYGSIGYVQDIPVMAPNNDFTCSSTLYGIECDTPSGIFTISADAGVDIYWVPDSSGIFYIDGDQLYYASMQERVPVLVDQGVLPPNYMDYRLITYAAGWLK